MSDDAARRDTPDAEPVEEHAHAAPPPAAPAPAAAPPPVTPPPVTPPPPAAPAPAGRWGPDLRVRRGPVIAGAALLLGCVLGAGVTAVGAAVAGSFRHGDGHSVRHDRGGYDRPDMGRDGRDGRKGPGGRPGHNQRPGPAATPTTVAPTTAAPSPSAS